MTEVKVNLSHRAINLLDQLKQEYGLKSRSQALEGIIEQLLEEPEETGSKPEE
jgi:metal-responsive CopG/Arc/MetJ family transcriptional regulator